MNQSVRLSAAELAAIEQARGPLSRASFIRAAIAAQVRALGLDWPAETPEYGAYGQGRRGPRPKKKPTGRPRGRPRKVTPAG